MYLYSYITGQKMKVFQDNREFLVIKYKKNIKK